MDSPEEKFDNRAETYDEVSKIIGRDIIALSTLEEVLDTFIAKHYIESNFIRPKFIGQVLENEYFSLNLKTRILGTILKNDYPDLKAFPYKEFRAMQTTRNIFAHGSIDGNKQFIDSVLITHGGQAHNFVDLHNDFVEKREIVQTALFNLPGVAVVLYDGNIVIHP